jgi:hypothetical protein
MVTRGFIFTITFFAFYTQAASYNLSNCLNISDNQQRLACYDIIAKQQQVNKINVPTAKPIPVVNQPKTSSLTTSTVKASQVNKTALIEGFGQKVTPKKIIDSVEFIIKSAQLNARKKWSLVFDNDQVWRATESGLRLKTGDHVIIKRAVLGSFLLKKKGSNKSIRVKRIK